MKQIYSFLGLLLMTVFLFACQSEELEGNDVGYLRVALEQSGDVNTKAYNAKQMHVDIKDANGNVKFTTDDHTDWKEQEFQLKQGKYTIEAVSYNYDNNSGEDRAYYMGKSEVTVVKGKTVTANVVCSLANVKVSVQFEQAFLNKLGNGTITVGVTSPNTASAAQNFAKTDGGKAVYFPEGDLKVTYLVQSADGKKSNTRKYPISGVKAKDHYILNFKAQSSGSGNVTVTVDPSMTIYEYTFTIDPNAKDGASLSANAWSRFAYLSASNIMFTGEISALKFQYRESGVETWTDLATTVDETAASASTAAVTGLTAGQTYEYRLTDGDIEVAKDQFTAATEVALPNSSFEDWYKSGNAWYAATQSEVDGGTFFWDSSNPGSSIMGDKHNPTTGDGVVKHGGNYSAKLETKYVVIKLAAASLYSGSFGKLVGTKGAKINFGRPFTSRPIALRGFFQYKPEVIDNDAQELGTSGVLKNGDTDVCAIYIALSKKQYEVDNTQPSTFINFKEDDNIIAYGELPVDQCVNTNGQWKEFTIPLQYKNLEETPSHIIVVCSSSKYGDYFTGAVGSTLYVDDFELVYDGEPEVWE